MSSALRAAAVFTNTTKAPLRTLFGRRNTTTTTHRRSGVVSAPFAVRAMASDASKKIVLVTGATGRVGKEVVARLAKEEGFIVRAATRDKADYATSLGAHETVTFDLEDKSTWAPAMEGVTHLFSSTQDKYIAQHMVGRGWGGEREKGGEGSRGRWVVRASSALQPLGRDDGALHRMPSGFSTDLICDNTRASSDEHSNSFGTVLFPHDVTFARELKKPDTSYVKKYIPRWYEYK